MDEFMKLNWAWSNVREATNPQHYDATFGDQPLDPLNAHLNEIRLHNLLYYLDEAKQSGASGSDGGRLLPCDPRNGRIVETHYIDVSSPMTTTEAVVTAPPKTASGQQRQSSSSISVVDIRLLREQFELCHQQQTSSWKRLRNEARRTSDERQKRYFRIVRDKYRKSVERQLCDLRPFRSDEVKEKWLERVAKAQKRYAGQVYVLRSALMLNPMAAATAATTMPRIDVVQGQLITHGSRVLRYCRVEGSRPAGSSPYVVSPSHRLFSGDGIAELLHKPITDEDVRMLMDVRVVRTLVDWPANSTQPWTIPFEVRELNGQQPCCVFDWVLPEPELRPRWLHRVALRQQLMERNVCVVERVLAAGEAKVENPSTTHVDLDRHYSALRSQKYLHRKHSAKRNQTQQKPEPYACSVRILTLRPEEFDAPGGQPQEPISLLVDCGIDGMEGEGEYAIPVQISVKPEYRLEWQTERMTESELIDEWCRHFVCPGSVTDRYRIDVNTGTVMSVVRLSLDDIEKEMFDLYGLTRNVLLTRLYSFINAIQHFPCQKYWFRSNPPDQTVRVYSLADSETANSTSGIATIQYLDSPRDGTDEFVCQPIDDGIMTSIYERTVNDSTANRDM